MVYSISKRAPLFPFFKNLFTHPVTSAYLLNNRANINLHSRTRARGAALVSRRDCVEVGVVV